LIKIAVIDYGVGNLRSIRNGLIESGSQVKITHDKKEIINSDAIVLPGVGAFKGALSKLSKLSKIILKEIWDEKPVLGICLGLQLLCTESTEGGHHMGLDVFQGSVLKLPSKVKIPHIGWNTLDISKKNPILENISSGAYVYFVHSYYAKIDNDENIIAKTYYGKAFPSVISSNNVYATQFHPEKSGKNGLRILKNFIEMIE
jgi:glutamine amidotransferase